MILNRILAVARKEVFHILRDPFTLGLAIFLPLILVIIFGLAIELNVSHIRLSVLGAQHSSASRRVCNILQSSKFFQLSFTDDPSQNIESMDTETTRAALIIPPDFAKNIVKKPAHVQWLLDGSDSTTIGSVIGYIGKIENIVNDKIGNFSPSNPIKIKTRFLYNPELNSRWFVVPGLMVIILAILSILLTALTIAREWENGSMELLLSTPVSTLEIILGKLLPYIGLCFLAVASVYVTARIFLGVPFAGSYWIFVSGCFLFLGTCLSLGLLISVITRQQRMAMQLSLIASLLPSMLLSGFIFPIESMPTFFQYFTMIFPARWFMIICRNCFLKEGSWASVQNAFLALFVMCTILIFLARLKFKRKLQP